VIRHIRVNDIPVIHATAFGKELREFNMAMSIDVSPCFWASEADLAGTETYDVTIHKVTGPDRDRIYGEQAHRYPGFAEYERQTAGIRTIPVLELRRAS